MIGGIKLAISYKKLLKLLIDKGWQKKDLMEKADLSWATISKFSKENQYVNLRTIERICQELDCQPSDIMEVK